MTEPLPGHKTYIVAAIAGLYVFGSIVAGQPLSGELLAALATAAGVTLRLAIGKPTLPTINEARKARGLNPLPTDIDPKPAEDSNQPKPTP